MRKYYNRDIKIVYIRQKGSDRYNNRKEKTNKKGTNIKVEKTR